MTKPNKYIAQHTLWSLIFVLLIWTISFAVQAASQSEPSHTTTAFALADHVPYQTQKQIKPFRIVYRAIADIGISISGNAWERLTKQGDKWLYETEIGALGAKSGEKLVFSVNANGHFNPISYTITDSGWTDTRVRTLSYNTNDKSLTFHDSKNDKTSTRPWPQGSLDALSMRLVVMDVLAKTPHIKTISYNLLDGDDAEPRAIHIQARRATTLNKASINTVHLILEDSVKQKITLTLAPTWHYLPVLLELRKPTADVKLQTKTIDYDGVPLVK